MIESQETRAEKRNNGRIMRVYVLKENEPSCHALVTPSSMAVSGHAASDQNNTIHGPEVLSIHSCVDCYILDKTFAAKGL